MDKGNNGKNVSDHIEIVLLLMKSLKYIPQSTVLTRKEREKLYKLFYSYDEYGCNGYVFGQPTSIRTEAELDDYNDRIFKSLDKEAMDIIVKCGVNPKKVFYMDASVGNMDARLKFSMNEYAIANVGEYDIEFTREHPVNLDDEQLKHNSEKIKKIKYDKYKNGEPTFRVTTEVNGEKETIYYHSEKLKYDDYVSFMYNQISGPVSINGYRISAETGLMKMEEPLYRCKNQLMPFFEYFEGLLSEKLAKEIKNDKNSRTRK